MELNVVFIDLKCRRLQTSPADLEKHLTFVFFLWVDFLRIFENITFFEILFYLIMVGYTL